MPSPFDVYSRPVENVPKKTSFAFPPAAKTPPVFETPLDGCFTSNESLVPVAVFVSVTKFRLTIFFAGVDESSNNAPLKSVLNAVILILFDPMSLHITFHPFISL